MKLRYLENFVAIVEKQSISSAARSQMIAQPALSKQLQNLERHYGTTLINRSPHNTTLTDAGKILYEYAKTILAAENLAQYEIEKCAKGQLGTLRLGVSATPDRTVESLLVNFQEENPSVSYEVHEASADSLIRSLEDKTIEIAIMRIHENAYPEIERIVSTKERLMVIYRRDCGLLPDDAKAISPTMLEGVPLSLTNGMKDMVLNALAREMVVPKIKCISNGRNTAYIWCKKGACVTILPVYSALDYENENFCCRPLDSEGCNITRSIVHRKGYPLSPASREFLNFCKHFYSQEQFQQIV